MDETYAGHGKPKKRWEVIVLLTVILLVVSGSIYLWLSGKKQIISPVPAQPAFEIIFYTPTPGPVTPSSTPSATPKVKKTPTNTPAPTKVEILPTVTSKPSATAIPTP